MTEYGDWNHYQDNHHYASGRGSKGDILVERFLVQGGPSLDAPGSKHLNLLTEVAPVIISANFSNYDVLGATLFPVPPNSPVRTYYAGVLGTQEQYTSPSTGQWWIIDFVFRLTTSDIAWISEDDLAVMLSNSLRRWAGNPPVVIFLAMGSVKGAFRSGGRQEAYDLLWSGSETLVGVVSGQVGGYGQKFEAGQKAGTFGPQFAYGLSDYPEALRPITWSTDVLTGEGKTPQVPWGTQGGGLIPGSGTSTQSFIAWGVAAAAGFFVAKTLWDRYR